MYKGVYSYRSAFSFASPVRVSPCALNLTCNMPGVPSSKGCEACRKAKKKVFTLVVGELLNVNVDEHSVTNYNPAHGATG